LDFDDLHSKLGIPRTGREPEVFGALWVDSREVFVDQSLDPTENPQMECRYRFTVSHEIGHWRLHRDYLASAEILDPIDESVKSGVVICRSSEAKKRVEWQADYFASAYAESAYWPPLAGDIFPVKCSRIQFVARILCLDQAP
jgi:hypothetical protein